MRELSIVFQGPIGKHGVLCDNVRRNLQRTRETFPLAEIIVSTWRHTPQTDRAWADALATVAVRLVLSDDPGALTATDGAGMHITNLNRQGRSAQVGLASATRPLAVKLRTDTWLDSRALVSLLERYVIRGEGPVRDPAYRVFRARVINASWFARDARGSLPYLYHPGDILLAGYTEDVRLFFSAPMAGLDLFAPAAMPGLWCAWRYVPEQWFWVHAIRQATGTMVYPGNFHYTPDHIASSERWFLANFVPFRPRQLGFHWPKYWRRYPLRGLFSTLTYARWQRLAQRCQGGSTCTLGHLADRLLTAVWRTGYRLRTRILRYPWVRRTVLLLFARRQ